MIVIARPERPWQSHNWLSLRFSPPPFMGEVGCEASHQIFVGEGVTEKLRGVVARNSHQPYQKNSVLSFSAPPPPAVRAASGLHFAGEGWVGAG